MKRYLKFILIPSVILFIGVGIIRGETSMVLIKAINICLECIGIG